MERFIRQAASFATTEKKRFKNLTIENVSDPRSHEFIADNMGQTDQREYHNFSCTTFTL